MVILFRQILLNPQLFEVIQNAATSYAGLHSPYTKRFHLYILMIFLKQLEYIFGYYHRFLNIDGSASAFPSIASFFQTDRVYSTQEKLSVASFGFDGLFESLRSQKNLQRPLIFLIDPAVWFA